MPSKFYPARLLVGILLAWNAVPASAAGLLPVQTLDDDMVLENAIQPAVVPEAPGAVAFNGASVAQEAANEILAASALPDSMRPAAPELVPVTTIASVAMNAVVADRAATADSPPYPAWPASTPQPPVTPLHTPLWPPGGAGSAGNTDAPAEGALRAPPPAPVASTQRAVYTPPEDGEVTFDLNLLRGSSQVDLRRFSKNYGVTPGMYQVDIYVNTFWRGRVDMYFAPRAPGELTTWPCYDNAVLDTMGFDLEQLSAQNKAALAGGREFCGPLEELYPDAHAEYDSGLLRLDVTVAQRYLRPSASRDFVAPALWDDGVTAAILNYRHSSTWRETRSGRSNNHYVGIDGGLNWGSWRLRHRGSIRHDTDSGLHYDNMALTVERPLRSLKSHLVAGQTQTGGWVFDAMDFTGLRMGSETLMRPDWEQQFAPQVRGIARTNARVRIEQQDSVIYETTVPPGPFIINDIPSLGSRGELTVTVIEADGSEQRFTVNNTNISEMLRPGLSDYSLSLGRFRGNGRLRRDPWLLQASMRHGFSTTMTGYAGLLGAEGYGALALGSAFNLSIGALAGDITLAHAGTHLGYRMRTSYTKNLPEMGTYLTLGFYRNSSRYFDPVQGFNINNGMPWNTILQRRNQLTLGVNQVMPEGWGTLSTSIGYSDFWHLPAREVEYRIDYSVVFANKFNVGLSLNRNLNTLANRWVTQAMLTFSMPLGIGSPTSLETRLGRNDTGHSLMTGISSTAGAQHQVSYQMFANVDKPKRGSFQPTGIANVAWRASQATVNANAYIGRRNRQLGVGVSGSLVAFGGGVVLGNMVGDTTAIVRAPGAEGARVENRIGTTLDASGKGMVPARPYRINRIRLGVEGLSSDVQLISTEQQTAPTSGAVVVLDYETDVNYSILLKGNQAGGAPLPFAAAVIDADQQVVGYVGQGGQALVRARQAQGVLTVVWGQEDSQRCTIRYTIDEKLAGGSEFRTLEGVVCTPDAGVAVLPAQTPARSGDASAAAGVEVMAVDSPESSPMDALPADATPPASGEYWVGGVRVRYETLPATEAVANSLSGAAASAPAPAQGDGVVGPADAAAQ